MKIAVFEHLPILETLVKKRLRAAEETARITVEKAVVGRAYPLLISDRSHVPSPLLASELILLPGGEFIPETMGTVLTGGMKSEDTVSFSSIGEDRAMLCLQREISLGHTFIDPFEKSVPYDRNHTLYKNLAAGFALCLAEILLREES